MKTQDPQDFPALFQEIAAYFSDWTLALEDHCNAVTFTRKDGAAFVLRHSRYSEPERLRVYGRYPETNGSPRNGNKRPEISVSHRRPTEAIAKDITRRFLGNYIQTFEAIVAIKHEEDATRERGKKNFAILTAVFANCLDQVRVYEAKDNASLYVPTSATGGGFNVDVEASYFSQTVRLKCDWLPIPIAKQFLEVIRELLPRNA
jgi:hypothetical protein